MTGTSDEGYESWMDEAGLSDESAHPSDMPNKADTASKRSRESPQYFRQMHGTTALYSTGFSKVCGLSL